MYPTPYRTVPRSPKKPVSKKRQDAAARAARQPVSPVQEGQRVIIVRDSLFGVHAPSSLGQTGTVIGFQDGDPARPQVQFDADGVPNFKDLSDVRAL